MTLKLLSSYAPVDGDFSDVSLLLLGEGTNGSTTITDSSSNNLSVSVNGDAQISTAVNTPFGAGDGVLAFDGTGDYLTVPSSTDWTLGSSGDFTIECWIYPNGSQGTIAGVVSTFTDWNSYQNRWAITINNLTLRWYDSLGNFGISGSVLSTQWSHLAVSRSGLNINLFVNGTLTGTQTTNQVYTTQERLIVGSMPGQSDFNGYISNLRITKGIARYTQDFTPPTAPFPDLSPSGRVTIEDNSLDVDARQYIINVEEQDGQPLESGVRTAINDFVVGCKSDGIWNAIKSSCIMAGARTLDGALVPLKGGAPTKFNFTSSDYDRELGLLGDASTKYLASNYAFPTSLRNNCHLSGYFSAVGTTGVAIGAYGNVGAQGSYLAVKSARLYQTSTVTFVPSDTTSTGFRGVSRNNGANYLYRRAGSNETANIASLAVTHENQGIFARRRNTGSYDSFCNARLSFYSIGESLDLALLDTRVGNLMTAIGAAIP